MNDDIAAIMKVGVANLISWGGTIFAAVQLADVAIVVAIIASTGSIAVSYFSVKWIRQQMAAHKKSHGPRNR